MTDHDDIPGIKRRGDRSVDLSRLDRLPPHSAEAEQGVLGCALIDFGVFETILERLTCGSGVFYDLRHRTLYEVLVEMHANRQPVDLITLGTRLKKIGQLDGIGGLAYISELQSAVPSAANVTYYLDILMDCFQRREVLRVGMEMAARVHEGHLCGAELVAAAGKAVDGLAESAPRPVSPHINDVLKNVVAEIEQAHRGRKQMRGLATGLNYLDNMTCGWKPEEYVLIVARPGGGKTSIGMQFVEHAVVNMRQPVGVFSQEMSYKVLVERMLFSVSGVNYQRYRNGFFRDTDLQHLTQGLERLKGVPLHIDDSSSLYCEDLEIRARRWVRDHGVKLILIDYLQLMLGCRGVRYGGDNGTIERQAQASATIMKLKKELKIPIIVLAQENTNRERADRDRRPLLSDVKGSQNAVQDADVVAFLCDVDLTRAKRDLHSKDDFKRAAAEAQFRWRSSRSVLSLPADIREDEEANLKRVNLYVAKQRNGPTGDCALVFVKPWMRFVDAYVEGAETASQEAGHAEEAASQEEFGSV